MLFNIKAIKINKKLSDDQVNKDWILGRKKYK
jgi:hypothetical protein